MRYIGDEAVAQLHQRMFAAQLVPYGKGRQKHDQHHAAGQGKQQGCAGLETLVADFGIGDEDE